jgi:hypothetical protein
MLLYGIKHPAAHHQLMYTPHLLCDATWCSTVYPEDMGKEKDETGVCLCCCLRPQVFVKGEFVGGSDILMEMHNAGELAQLAEELKK